MNQTTIRQSWQLPTARVELVVYGDLTAEQIAGLTPVVQAIESFAAPVSPGEGENDG